MRRATTLILMSALVPSVLVTLGCARSSSDRRKVLAPIPPLEVEWRKRCGDAVDGRDKAAFVSRYVHMDELISGLDAREFTQEYEDLLARGDDETPYAAMLREEMVHALAQRGDAARVLRLLSVHCPYHLELDTTELVLATSPLDDSVSLLVEAFEESSSAANRKMIAACLHRAFDSVIAKEADDRLFVVHCRDWFVQRRGLLIVNAKYDSPQEFTRGIPTEWGKVPLYIPRKSNSGIAPAAGNTGRFQPSP